MVRSYCGFILGLMLPWSDVLPQDAANEPVQHRQFPERTASAAEPAETRSDPLSRYDVVWTTTGEDSRASMPLGNGDIGLNLWTSQHDGVAFYLSKTDAWSENARLLKLGRVRLQLSPNPLAGGHAFEQALRLRTGEIVIRSGTGDPPTSLRVWVDANRPVIHIEGESTSPIAARISLEPWRTTRRRLTGVELQSAYGLAGDDAKPVFVEPDTVVEDGANRVTWYHRNERSIWPDNLKLQALGGLADPEVDPLQDRTFGGTILGEGFVRDGRTALRTAEPTRRFHLEVHVLTSRTDTAQQWLRELDDQVGRESRRDQAHGLAEHRRWWDAFWNRSWIEITGTDSAFEITRGYLLQRFINACGGRGQSPIKFNGSIFTVDLVEPIGNAPAGLDADFRMWGGPYWWQNTRLPYWAMLACGDLDLMPPLFRMYRDALPIARVRTRLYYGHDGVFYPETMYFWGTYTAQNYGMDRTGKPRGLTDNRYIRYEWQGGIELTLMMLEYYDLTRDTHFLTSTLLPIAEGVTTFYDRHYERDASGKIHFWPAQALETYWDVPNPMPEIAGLRAVLPRLRDLPHPHTTGAQRERWQRMLEELPALPKRELNDQTILAPAGSMDNKSNSEDPELYAVFPYGLFGVGKDGLELARRTFEHRLHRGTGGWRQDAIHAALLGLTDQAAAMVTANFTRKHPGSRFPAFWGPNYDWVPDQDHGSVAMIALQRMLMQCDGRQVLLLPAWPKDWDVRFRLHAPFETTVEGVCESGRLTSLVVSPASRAKDVVIAHD